MKAELTRDILEKNIPKTLFKQKLPNFELQHVLRELAELERLAEIGEATERAFAIDNPVLTFHQNGEHLIFTELKDLLEWAEIQGDE
jgi:hypothetical protein